MKQYSFLLYALLLFSCARQAAPTGGPKDTEPPKVEARFSTPNQSVRFTERRIVLQFDEWVTLSDVATQIVVSPPLLVKRVPEVRLKGKSVVLEFDEKETLRPNTTYTINFGNAVKDLHEGNVATDLRFVFSTGDFIDSMRLSGIVVDAYTGAAVENAAVFLYEQTQDSIILQEKPYYFTKTDKAGLFTVGNVRKGVYQCVALADEDQNLKWTGDLERIAFSDTLIDVDGEKLGISFRLFKNNASLRLFDKNTSRYGLVKLTYNSPPPPLQVMADDTSVTFVQEYVQDTLLVWYNRVNTGNWNLRVGNDTILVRQAPRETFLNAYRLRFAGESGVAGTRGRGQTNAPPPKVPPSTMSQNPEQAALIRFGSPITRFDTAFWRLESDSIGLRTFTVSPDSASPRALQLAHDWKPGERYRLVLLPGAVVDLFGIGNMDTLIRNIEVLTDKQLGNLSLSITGLRVGKSYLLELLNNEQVAERRRFVAERTTYTIPFSKLQPATYTARLVEDANGNGRWDAGNYFQKRQPEWLSIKKLEALRANWELEATMDVSGNLNTRK